MVFDDLIGNTDPNLGNLLVDAEWNVFLVDHSRAFMTETKLPAQMSQVDPELWSRMLALDESAVTAAIATMVLARGHDTVFVK
jgi:hypothetical protein